MLKVVFNIVRSLFSFVFGLFRPLRRLWCRRLKASEHEPGIPTTVTGQSLTIDMPQSFGGNDEADLDMESWDVWDMSSTQPPPPHHPDNSPLPGPPPASLHGQYSSAKPGMDYTRRGRRAEPSPDPEPEPDYFQDMQPEVKKAAKILVKKKDNGTVNMSTISSRLTVMGDAVPMASELQSWEDGDSTWADEVSEDLSWEADAVLKEKRRLERQERMAEQQRRKHQRDAMRGLKKDSSIAVKLS